MILQIYEDYFSYLRVIAAIILPLASILVLFLFFRRSRNPRSRSWSLGMMMLSSIFLWLFIGLSLILCYTLSELYEYQPEVALRTVFGTALLLAVLGGLPLSLLLTRFSPRIVLSRVKNLSPPKPATAISFDALRRTMGVTDAELMISKTTVPISFAVEVHKPIIVMSEELLSLLKKDEIEAVMAHELAHVKNSDTALKAMVTAYKTALPQDPIIRLVEAAFHREREMVADEIAARTTKKPLSLASALLKISDAFPKNALRSYGTLSILGSGRTLLSRHPPTKQRIQQLVRLAEIYGSGTH
ncbi:MAG TPA: M48 family metalloprotease [Candidatus Acidoferrales bacterium]|nr:M48 family metalloprotease [Candidatus Acidoferrales bacterium]